VLPFPFRTVFMMSYAVLAGTEENDGASLPTRRSVRTTMNQGGRGEGAAGGRGEGTALSAASGATAGEEGAGEGVRGEEQKGEDEEVGADEKRDGEEKEGEEEDRSHPMG